jgi:hypothetical protein
MNAAAQATLIHAAELLEAQASKLFEHQDKDQRIAGHKTRADTLTTALELRLLAKRIIPITAVSPVPTFEGERKCRPH